MFTPLNLPKAPLKLTRRDQTVYVFDVFRKKELVLTPEEWVRQHYLHYLVHHKNVPLGLISSEYALKVNTMQRRCDAVIFDKHKNPIVIVECKAPTVALSEKTLHQIAQYNFKLQVNWLVLTNGLKTVTCYIDPSKRTLSYLEEIPSFEKLFF